MADVTPINSTANFEPFKVTMSLPDEVEKSWLIFCVKVRRAFAHVPAAAPGCKKYLEKTKGGPQ